MGQTRAESNTQLPSAAKSVEGDSYTRDPRSAWEEVTRRSPEGLEQIAQRSVQSSVAQRVYWDQVQRYISKPLITEKVTGKVAQVLENSHGNQGS